MTAQKLYPQTLKEFGRRETVSEVQANLTDTTTSVPEEGEEEDIYHSRVFYLPSIERSTLYGNGHPIVATDQWEAENDEMEVPLVIPFKDTELCDSLPLVIITAQYQAVDKMVPMNRNPV